MSPKFLRQKSTLGILNEIFIVIFHLIFAFQMVIVNVIHELIVFFWFSDSFLYLYLCEAFDVF